MGRLLDVELPLLAKEVSRIETLRLYAETTLQLETLVGDLEDAAFAMVSQTSINDTLFGLPFASNPHDNGRKQEKLLLAVKVMKNIEQILVRIANCRPRWIQLIMAVDLRVDKCLAIFRPQTLRDHGL